MSASVLSSSSSKVVTHTMFRATAFVRVEASSAPVVHARSIIRTFVGDGCDGHYVAFEVQRPVVSWETPTLLPVDYEEYKESGQFVPEGHIVLWQDRPYVFDAACLERLHLSERPDVKVSIDAVHEYHDHMKPIVQFDVDLFVDGNWWRSAHVFVADESQTVEAYQTARNIAAQTSVAGVYARIQDHCREIVA